MNSTTNLQPLIALRTLRQEIYAAFTRAQDALMNTADALLTETQAQSLPELSLSPHFERRWHSLYEAFEDGKIDRNRLRNAFAQAVPNEKQAKPAEKQARLVLGTDASSIARPKAVTARDRTLVHEANLPEGCRCPPVVAGWQFSTLALLPQSPSSWTYTLDTTRITSHQTTAQVAAEQLQQIVPLLSGRSGRAPLPAAASSSRPLLLGDGYYSCLPFLCRTRDVACDKLIRLAKNRVLYRPAPARTGKRGRPKQHGAPFRCNDPGSQQEPDEAFQNEQLQVACWKRLHFREEPGLPVTVLRVVREAAADTKRDPKVSWFLFVGEQMPALSQIPSLYARRYSLEHGYRVDKQDLLWERVRLRTPEQFERWTDIVACVRNQLCLARPLCCARQPWERPSGKVGAGTPSQVRRGLRRIMPELGTPASLCRPRGKSPGRVPGVKVTRAERYPVLRKSPKLGTPKATIVQT
jgi:hypothetical protein